MKYANVIGGKSALLLGCFRPKCHGERGCVVVGSGLWECELRYVLSFAIVTVRKSTLPNSEPFGDG